MWGENAIKITSVNKVIIFFVKLCTQLLTLVEKGLKDMP